ncbi:hypothetical protein NEF87_003437 [Candidatus Lokiarchaeum ossiferum]|uniref:ABC3 transporter permease C-terminal domain-containing protein n=1 Tax=Candidatus Lokiarchaeum ossiferum TaxID=2951803 RepID=A0ABY6HXS7_9ARCH|nr:hypothetical protein NEF87_003437 [Candidatus Lokiarchaeum sp. B-35]
MVEIKANKKSNAYYFRKRIIREFFLAPFHSIVRNKRRSMAMLSGIVLAVTLLSGILLYNDELKQNNYKTIVQDFPYDARFDIMGNETLDNMKDLESFILNDSRTLDTALFASSRSNMGNNWLATYVTPKYTNNSEIDYVYYYRSTFVSQDIFTGPIGQSFMQMNFKGEANLTGRSVILPESFLESLDLTIGDSIDMLNFSQTIYSPSGDPNENHGFLTNLTIRGTYDPFEQQSDEMNSIHNPFHSDRIYLSLELLNNATMVDVHHGFTYTGNFYLALKIDVSQFNVKEPIKFNKELNLFINQLTRDYSADLQGYNEIEQPLLRFQSQSIFITFLYIVLAIPVVLLSLYLLNFGLEMALEERRRAIAIKKVQGANSKQIFSELRDETLFLLIGGSVLGYCLGIIAAWAISSASGFMQTDFQSNLSLWEYFSFDLWAFIIPFIVVSVLLIIVTYKKGKKFIEQEVTQGVAKRELKKERIFKRYKLDIICFMLSLSGIALVMIKMLKIPIPISQATEIAIFVISPFMFWIGGSSVGSRIVKKIPLKMEKSLLAIPVFHDVKQIIKSGLKRRGDIERLAVIIILTLSIASLATIQGNTEETQAERSLEWQIGADWQINFAEENNYHDAIANISGLDDSIALNSMNIRSLSSWISVIAMENEQELLNLKQNSPVLFWQNDNFDAFTAEGALQALEDNPEGIFLTADHLYMLDAKVGDLIEIRIYVSNSSQGEVKTMENIKILGTVNQLPGGIQSYGLISRHLFLKFQALSNGLEEEAMIGSQFNATRYYVHSSYSSNISAGEIEDIKNALESDSRVSNYLSYYEQYAAIDTTEQGYGISGLLSLNFVISLVAVFISAFSFSAILMERRKHEFAILRAIGAKKGQIYKMVIGENSLMMLTASIWGIFIGVGISYLFNNVFIFINMMLQNSNSVYRSVVLPGVELLIISCITFFGMMAASVLSVRSAANQDLSLATKVV